MEVTNIDYTNFRNIEREKIQFEKGVNVIYGKNAVGKTNIIEGIYLFARGKSFRAMRDKELIRFGSNIAYARLEYEKNDSKYSLSCQIDKNGPKSFYKEGNKVSKVSDVIGEFRAVLFCPAHLGIINDSPSIRRNFLDIAISQINHDYIKKLSKYNATLINRNAVLKLSDEEFAKHNELLNVYSETLSEIAAEISLDRKKYITKLDMWLKDILLQMTQGTEKAKISYETSLQKEDFESKEKIKAKFLSLLTDNIERERKNGSTLFGTHKDDLKIDLNGKDARLYSSQGQQRSLALALKISELEISRENTRETPILLLDDVLSELDQERRKFILSSTQNKQVIITSCEIGDFSNLDINFIERKE